MGIDSPQDISGALVRAAPWVDLTKDYKETKVVASNLSSTVSGIKGDITLMKAEMAGLFALSLGLVKIDYTWLKLDDKGLTINGRQRFGWPWADQAKHFQLRLENQRRDLVGNHKSIKKKLDRITTRQAELIRAQDRLKRAEERERKAQSSNRPRTRNRATERADLARADVARLQKQVDRAEKSARRLAKSASKTWQKIDRLERKEKAAKNRWETDAGTATNDLNALRTALRQAELAAGSSS